MMLETIGLAAYRINRTNPSGGGRRRSGGRGLAVELCIRAFRSGMESANGEQFIRNGL